MKKVIISSLSLLMLFGFSFSVFAVTEVPTNVTSIDALISIINTIANWIFAILLALAVVMLLLAAFNWLTSGGSEEKVSSARRMLIWALVGIAVALAAKGLVEIVKALIGG